MISRRRNRRRCHSDEKCSPAGNVSTANALYVRRFGVTIESTNAEPCTSLQPLRMQGRSDFIGMFFKPVLAAIARKYWQRKVLRFVKS